MNIFDNLKIHKNKIVAIDEEENTFKYCDLLNESSKIKSFVSPRDNIFLLCENSFEFLCIYVGLITNKNIVYLIDRSTTYKNFLNLKKIHKPKFIFFPKEFLGKLNINYHSNVNKKYYITSTNYNLNLKFEKNISILLSTSGSTGNPKFVKLSYSNIKDNTQKISSYLNITKNDRTITTMECSYSYGMSIINTHLYRGASIVLTKKSFFEKSFWYLMKKYKVTTLNGVPFSFEILDRINFYKKKLPHLKKITQAGGKLKLDIYKKIINFLKKRKIKFFSMYGQTEASPRMSYLLIKDDESKIGSIGKPIQGGNFKIFGNNNKIIKKDHTIGELVYQGKNVMLGYAETIKDLTKSKKIKYLFTGDLAYFDKKGFYFIVGRKNRLIKIHGIRYNLDDIEKELNFSGFPSAVREKDEKLNIFITKKNNHIENNLNSFLLKKYNIRSNNIIIQYIKKIPRNLNGKISYSRLPI